MECDANTCQVENTQDENGNEDGNVNNNNNVPIDRGWAWTVVIAAFGICAFIGGVINSFGVLLLELSRQFEAPARVLASSQSLCGFLHLGIGPISNALSMRFTHRKIVFVGGLLSGVGLILTAYVETVELFYVTYGLITGIGFGLCVCPSLVFPGFYFKKRLAIANGIATAGTGIGVFFIPILMRTLFDKYSIEGCLLVLGGITFNICVCASLQRPLSFWTNSKYKDTRNNERQPLKHSEQCATENGEVIDRSLYRTSKLEKKLSSSSEMCAKSSHKYSAHSVSVPCLKSECTMSYHYHRRSSNAERIKYDSENPTLPNFKSLSHSVITNASLDCLPVTIVTNTINHRCNSEAVIDKDINKSKRKIINWTILRDPTFQIVNIGMFFAMYGHHTMYYFIPPLANEIGLSDTEGALCVSIVGVTDMIGRLSSGFLSDTLCRNRRTTFQLNMLLFGCCNMLLAYMGTHVGYLITCGFLGLFTGGYMGIQVAVLAEIFGKEDLSTTWGFVAFFSSIAILINPAIAGVMRDYTGSWAPAFQLSSVLTIVGSISMSLKTLVRLLKCKK